MSMARHRLTSKLNKLSVCYGIEYTAHSKTALLLSFICVCERFFSTSFHNLISVEHTIFVIIPCISIAHSTFWLLQTINRSKPSHILVLMMLQQTKKTTEQLINTNEKRRRYFHVFFSSCMRSQNASLHSQPFVC